MKWMVACLVLAGPAAAGAQALDGAEAEAILAIHNRERALVGVPPLTWSAELAAGAAAHALHLAQLGRLEHAPPVRPPVGENLVMGTLERYSSEQLAESWVAEKARFRAGRFPDVSTTGDWRAVGHYTQMIWRGTTSVGCAVAETAAPAPSRYRYLVCRYRPNGNVRTRPVY